MADFTNITNTMQTMTLVGFIALSVLGVMGWKYIEGRGRYLAVAALSYTVPGVLVYTFFVFSETMPATQGLLSVILRWDSMILVAAGLILAIFAGRGTR